MIAARLKDDYPIDSQLDINPASHTISRRDFLPIAGFLTAGAWVGTGRRRAQHEGDEIVNVMRAAAVTAAIDVETLRGNVSVLMGSGGNICSALANT